MNKLEINKEKLKCNINTIIKKANESGNKTQIIAVVKINAYGLDMVPFSKFLIENGIDFLAVGTPEEAFTLRKNGIDCKILLLTPINIKNTLIELIKNDIIITVGSTYEVNLINEVYNQLNVEKVKVHVKVDSGFARYGFLYNNVEEIKSVFNNEKLEVQGIFTHFSNALDKTWTNIQYNRFTNVIKYLKKNSIEPGISHCCNSIAFFKYPNMHLDAVRLGSAWQGRMPENLGNLEDIGVLKSTILELRTVEAGANVSYSNKYTTKRKTTLATIPMGYLDGINKTRERDTFSIRDNLKAALIELKNIFYVRRLKVIINGKKCNIVGRLGTLHAIIDVTDVECKEGDEVIIDAILPYIDERIERKYV